MSQQNNVSTATKVVRTWRTPRIEPPPTTARHRVNILEGMDFIACALGEVGWATDAIVDATGLTRYQVLYRLSKGGVKRSDYRTGQSVIAKRILAFAKESLTPLMERKLIANLKASVKERAMAA